MGKSERHFRSHTAFFHPFTMQNDAGAFVDLYIPRKCSATNRVLIAKDHASVQLNVGQLDENGVHTGVYTTFALSGYIRHKAEADQAMNRLAASSDLIKALDSFPPQHRFKDEE